MSTLDLTLVLGILTLWGRGAVVEFRYYFSRADIGDENDQLGGVNTAAYCSWCRVLPGRFNLLVIGINRHINHQTLKCNPKEVDDHHQSPPRPPAGWRERVILENCQDPLFSDVTWQKVE